MSATSIQPRAPGRGVVSIPACRCGLLVVLLAPAPLVLTGCMARSSPVTATALTGDARPGDVVGAGGDLPVGGDAGADAGADDGSVADGDAPAGGDGPTAGDAGDSAEPGDATPFGVPPQLETMTSGLADVETSVTVAWTLPMVVDGYLLVSIGGSGYAIADTVTWQGQALGKLVEESGWPPVQQWGLVNPAAGAGDLVATFADPANAVIVATLFRGVNPGTPIGAPVHAWGDQMSNLGGSVAVVSGTTDLVVDVICTDLGTGSHTPAAGQTQIFQDEATDGEWVSVSVRQNASTMSWTWPHVAASHPGWSLAATPLRAAD